MPYTFEVGLESARGRREENQDRLTYFDSPFGRIFVVADGMGGHSGGAVASSLAVSSLPELMRNLSPALAPQDALVEAVQAVNTTIIEEARRGGEHTRQMGSTLVAVLFRDTEDGLLAVGAHVGDSRLYFARGRQMFCLTEDHTVVQQLVSAGALTSDEALHHPQASVLTRALGRLESLPVQLTSWTLVQPGDVFLLCSDGLSGYADDRAIAGILLQAEPVEHIASQLIGLAFERESQDNISVIVLRISELPTHWDSDDMDGS